MKWSLQQLFKYNSKQFSFTTTFDFSKEALEVPDILSISEVIVEGTGRNIRDDRYVFNLHIRGILTLEDAITLEAIEFPIELDTIEIYDVIGNDDEDIHIIEKNTIDLTDAVWENILLIKPMRVVKTELPE